MAQDSDSETYWSGEFDDLSEKSDEGEKTTKGPLWDFLQDNKVDTKFLTQVNNTLKAMEPDMRKVGSFEDIVTLETLNVVQVRL